MSHFNAEGPPKLLAQRFTKFKPSRIPNRGNEGSGSSNNSKNKRSEDDDEDDSIESKCSWTLNNLPISPIKPTKNLASMRLKKIKETIQASANNTYTRSRPSCVDTKESSGNILRNTSNSKLNISKKNLAEERLQGLKRRLSSSGASLKINQEQTATTQRPALKRKSSFSSTTQSTFDEDVPSKKYAGNEAFLIENSNSDSHCSTPISVRLSTSVDGSINSNNSVVNNSEICVVETNEMVKSESSGSDVLYKSVGARNLNNSSTTDYLFNETGRNDMSEDMEWSTADAAESSVNSEENPKKLQNLCIVVDTNVFISGLSKIKDVLKLKMQESLKPVIFVPWMVITELDYMKDSNPMGKLRQNIVDAIKFINAALKEENPRVVGQTVFEVEKQKHIGPSQDDKIIACCLQAAEKYDTVILLSNDTNLKNRAMINNITACSSNEIVMKLVSKHAKTGKSQKIMHKMGIMCSSVICECMKSTYGDVWSKMDMMSYPPWSLLECLKRFKKYWGSVFGDKVMKQFTKTVQELQELLTVTKHIPDDSEEFIDFMKKCVTLCVFLKDIEECRGVVESTLADITAIP